MPSHTAAKRAKNRSRAVTRIKKTLGAQFTEKEGKALARGKVAGKTKRKIGAQITEREAGLLRRVSKARRKK